MSEQNITVSVVVPIYNSEKYLQGCLNSIVNQTIEKEKIEVLLLIDGSVDGSADICREFEKKYSYIKAIYKENEGLPKTRNVGIEKARGKYIAFLDSDDRFSPTVLADTTSFFDKHYDEIDEVTYKIVSVENGLKKKSHYRYNIMKKTGVYDLSKGDNIYISQTNVNVVVKNLGENNVLFDTTKGFKHEDQEYNTHVLMNKFKIGFVDSCEYLYEKNPESIVSGFTASNIFDITITKWEKLFASFKDAVPEYIQGLFVNDIEWKIRADILLPYHLEGEEYEHGISRISNLLSRISDNVILNHPDCNDSNKYYFISMKYNNELQTEFGEKAKLLHNGKIISEFESFKIVLTRIKEYNGKLETCGYLYSPVFSFCDKPTLKVVCNDNEEELTLFNSSWCYNEAKIKNNQAWGFRYTASIENALSFKFLFFASDKEYKTEFDFGEWIVFNKNLSRYSYTLGRYKYSISNNQISVKKVSGFDDFKYKVSQILKYAKTDKKVCAVRIINLLLPKKRIWIYHDCKGVGKDNAYYQFMHDFDKKDGVKRYYSVNGSIDAVRDMFTPKQQKYLISFRSSKNKLLYLNAEKIITAFIEKVNYIPFFDDAYPKYIDLFNCKVVYLQHGVLHAHLPWKYSYDRLDLSYEVISTKYEVDNFTRNYCFPEESLIKSKMPRYDFIDVDEAPKDKKILFAPSWRKYLVTLRGDGEWLTTKEKFVESEYYHKTNEFLQSKKLNDLLEKNDWYLDYKPHPIFARYNDCFDITSKRINIPSEVNQSDYKVFITDYSSFVFDFVYLNRAIIYFMPDYKQFKSGMNDYRELDIPFENGFGEFTQSADEAVMALEKIIKNDGKPIPPFDTQNNDFFLNKDKNCREEIYQKITK